MLGPTSSNLSKGKGHIAIGHSKAIDPRCVMDKDGINDDSNNADTTLFTKHQLFFFKTKKKQQPAKNKSRVLFL